MKTTTKILALSFLLTGFIHVNSTAQQSNFINRFVLDPYNPEYVKNEILVKFKDEVKVEVGEKRGRLKTGVITFDNLVNNLDIEKISKVFKTEEFRSEKRYMKSGTGEDIAVPQLFNIYKIKFKSGQDPKELCETLMENPEIDFAEPNYLLYTQEIHSNELRVAGYTLRDKENGKPTIQPNQKEKFLNSTPINDPLYLDGSQWYIDAVHTPEAWELATGEGQVIAIIDTGVDWDHPDLDDNIWTNVDEIPDNGIDDDGNGYVDDIRGWDFVNDDNDPNDDNAHGTHVAGIAAGEGNNGTGIIGVAFNAKIIPVKILQSSGSGSSSDLASSIEYASDNSATVINMSLGSYGESMTVKIALENAYANAVLVAAAGNNGYKVDPPYPPRPLYAPMYPSCYGFVIGVEATTQTNTLASFSNFDPSGPAVAGNPYGHNYEIKASGVGIYSTFPNGNYNALSGTSMASPIVAGAVALMKSHNPAQSTEQIFAKLIQGVDNGIVDIENSIDYVLESDLHFVEYSLVDTLPGCDNDGNADAGETIEIYLTVKNAGGFADSVWSKLRFGAFEDTSVANIIDSTSYIGDISVYANLTGKLDPFRIEINPDVANNRDIVFEYEIGAANHNSFVAQLIFNVQNGIEIGGYYNENLYLKSNREYIGTQSVVIGDNDTLFIDPGVRIIMGNNRGLNVLGTIIAKGKKDSLIQFSTFSNSWGPIKLSGGIIEYSIIEGLNGSDGFVISSSGILRNCIITNNSTPNLDFVADFSYEYCNITNNVTSYIYPIEHKKLFHTNIINNRSYNYGPLLTARYGSNYEGSNIFNNFPYNIVAYASPDWISTFSTNTFYGSSSIDYIKETIYDFFDNSNRGIVNIQNWSIIPDSLTHGIVWKVEINNQNPQEVKIDPIGSETVKFDVFFNREMDTAFTPFLTFGVRKPYTQQVIQEGASWSADSTTWTAYYSVGLETGDGINTIRVANAKDTDHFEIPIEDSRFEFVIQAAGAASLAFQATPGIGKVELEWPEAETDDALGFNMYRFYNLTDSTFSDTTLINTMLITDTIYTDFVVIPDTTYHYLYKIVGTDMQESDFTKSVIATPFSAANGDANGDLDVNILDLTTIVAYILEQDPEPFLLDAADVNYDGQINVLDIISIVQLISGTKSSVSGFLEVNDKPAYIYLDNGIIQLKSDNQIAAMQFELEGENLENIRLFAMLEGFEFSYGIVDSELMGIIYSFNGNLIPGGLLDIIRVENSTGDLTWCEVFGGDLMGNYVNILTEKAGGIEELTFSENNIKVHPNPFYTSITLNYQIKENSLVNIDIYNINGQKVKTLKSLPQSAGQYEINWDGTNMSNRSLPSGIYFCGMIVRPINGNEVYVKDVKMVKIK